jgi:hypothetical protein
LPADVILPVIIRVTPPGGSPLLTVIPADADGTEIIANINPITSAVAKTLLGEVDPTDPADLAVALAAVDSTTVDEVGNALLSDVLGASIDYADFASDPNFVAANGDTSGSGADAIIDAIASLADDGTPIKDVIADLQSQPEPTKLLEEPAFQVLVVGELATAGVTDPAQITETLAAVGAVETVPDGEPDTFAAITAVVVSAVQATTEATASLGDNEALVELALEATVELIADSVQRKDVQYDATDQDLVDDLTSTSFTDTINDVVATVIVPVLEPLAAETDLTSVLEPLAAVTDEVVDEASKVISSFDYGDPTNDVSDLVAGYVSENVAPTDPLTVESLTSIAEGTTTTEDLVSDIGELNEVQEGIETFAGENPDLFDGDLQTVTNEVPAGTWGEDSWDEFVWG